MRFILILLSIFSLRAGASCFPENHKWLPSSLNASILKSSFDDAIKTVQDEFAPDVQAMGATLQINNMWDDGTVNSQAYQERRSGRLYFMIDAFGGLARYPGMTKRAFIQVLCHELGHHLGGAPRYGMNTDWAAVEGQADYFSSLKCMKRLGLASSASSLALAKVLADLGGEPIPGRKTRDMSAVRVTVEDHPEAQCRLDTFDAGRYCQAVGVLSKYDPRPGTCYDYDANGVPKGQGMRPRCWYAPRTP